MTSHEFLRKYREEMQGVPTDVALEYAFWRVGWLTPKEVESLATRLVEEGYDGQSLIALAAGLADSYTIEGMVDRAFAEIGSEMLSHEQAGFLVAQAIAARIVSGALSPDDGVALLSSLYWRLGYPAYLSEFYVLADYLEEQCYLTPELCRGEIVAEARKLLKQQLT